MKKQIKRTALIATLFLVLVGFSANLTSCKKIEQQKVADLVVGNYIGAGTTANDDPFIGQPVRIVKISSNRIRVEPVAHSFITAFEIDINYIMGRVVGVDDDLTLAIDLSESPRKIGFDNPNGESFGGFAQ